MLRLTPAWRAAENCRAEIRRFPRLRHRREDTDRI